MATLLEIIEAYKPYPKPNERAIPSTIIKKYSKHDKVHTKVEGMVHLTSSARNIMNR